MTIEDRLKIREAYARWTPRSDPYSYFKWDETFSPIERLVWSEIRMLGLPFYPEFPVGKYFIDFADPIKKIGIEVDGKEFHQDREKDKFRQNELENLGWMIFRISGSTVYKKTDEDDGDEEDRYDLSDFYSERILKNIKRIIYSEDGTDEPELTEEQQKRLKKIRIETKQWLENRGII